MTDALKVVKLALSHPGRTSALLNSIRARIFKRVWGLGIDSKE
jgi:hypothetical protein